MQWLQIAIAISLVLVMLSLTSLIAFLAIRQQRQIQTLTNLAASKDLAAFTSLETQSRSDFEPIEYMPLDDASVVERMREQYTNHGLNPEAAVNREDPFEEFGGFGNLLGN